MVRLIVDDAGNRRAFNVGEGRLSVGSGSEAKLKLASPGVASLHADIEVHGSKATLHPKPGVTAPHVLGRAVSGPVVLQHGVPVKIGGATVTVEYEGQPSKLAVPAVQAAGGSPRQTVRRRGEDDDDERGAGRKARRQGIPSWVWIALGVPLVGVVGWVVSTKALGGKAKQFGEASASAFYANAVDRVKNAQYPQAIAELARIPADAELQPELAAQIAQLRKEIATKVSEAEEHGRNAMAGKQYFDTQLKGFVDRYMSGQITSPEARVFLSRARYFREKWPTHPELDWVSRQEARFKNAIDLSQPPTLADITFEVESLTWSYPRKYREAFAVARAFQSSAAGDEVGAVAAFIAELETKRTEWFEDRLEQARFHYDRKEEGKSIGVLLSIIRYAGDEAMEDEAAEQLMRFGDMQTWLRGYRTNDPEGFEAITKNRVIAAFLKDHKL